MQKLQGEVGKQMLKHLYISEDLHIPEIMKKIWEVYTFVQRNEVKL